MLVCVIWHKADSRFKHFDNLLIKVSVALVRYTGRSHVFHSTGIAVQTEAVQKVPSE